MNKSNDSFLSIGDLFRLCVVRWRWFVVSVLVCLLFAVRYLLTTPYLYTRSASIMVNEDVIGSNATDNNSKDFNNIGFVKQKSNVTDVIRRISSLDVLVDVAQQVDKQTDISEAISIAEDMQDRLTAESEDKNSNVINLSYKDYSTAQAERTLSLIIKVFNEKCIHDKQEVIRNSSLFIDSKLRLLEHELNLVDDSISSYKSKYGITELKDVSDVYLKQQSETDAEILKLMNQKAMAEYIRSLLQDEASQQQLLLVNSGINNTLIESQITLYNSLLLQMQSHMEYTSGQNPLIINLEKELKSLRKNILANVINHIRTIDIQLQSLRAYHGETTSKITSNPDQAKYLISIEREQKVKESLYMYLLQKKEENEISLTYKPAPTQIVDMPHGSGKPTSPKRIRVLLAAVLLGILLPVIWIFIRATMDSSVRGRSDMEFIDGISFLGEVPFMKKKISVVNMLRRLSWKSDCEPIVVSYGGHGLANEAFRLIRTRLELINNSHVGRNVYLVTSSQEDTGKTFVAMNLAIVLAIAGKRVLFIDGNLRKGDASRRWNTSGKGLSEYLNGLTDNIDSLLFLQDKFPTLKVLPSGSLPANPTELLNDSRFAELISQVRQKNDYVIIDTPQADTLADAEIISRYADCTLNVIRAGMYERSNLDLLKQQEGERPNKLVILNGVCMDSNC